MFGRFLQSLVVVVTLNGIALQATADSVDEQLASASQLSDGAVKLAQRFKAFADAEKSGDTLVLGDFTAPPRLQATGGPALRHALQEALKQQGIQVSKSATWQLIGQFSTRLESEDEVTLLALQLKATVLDGDDREVKRFSISVRGDDVLQIAGATVDLPAPNAKESQRQSTSASVLNAPRAAISGNETRPSDQSLFGIEVLVRNGESSIARKPSLDEGRSYVKLHKGEEYIVRLHNHAPFEAAVTLSIDGLNMFTFSKAGNVDSQVLVPAGKAADIRGWFIDPHAARSFEISSYGDSEAAKLGAVGDIGTITARFSAAWRSPQDRPADEPRTKGPAIGTKLGQPLKQEFTQVSRTIGRPRAFVSVRYHRSADSVQ